MKGEGLLGKKIGMTTIFAEDGSCVPVTVIKAGPCPVVQKKNTDKDGYQALQVAFDEVSEKKVNKPQQGHLKKSGTGFYRYLREFRFSAVDDFEVGQILTIDMFTVGERVKVTGRSKGRGFAGVMKRWNFRGLPASHGHHKVHRSPGSIGQCAYPAKVFKGKKMAGHMGNAKVTIKNIEIVDIRKEDHLLLIKGQVPGSKNSLVVITKQN